MVHLSLPAAASRSLSQRPRAEETNDGVAEAPEEARRKRPQVREGQGLARPQ